MSASVILHAVLVGGAVVATGLRAESAPKREPPESLVYVKAEVIVPSRRSVTPQQRTESQEPPVAPPLLRPLPELIGALPIDPTIVPTTIPEPGISLAPIGERRIATLPGPRGGDSTSSGGTGDAPFSAFTVEREVQLLTPTSPRYPTLLRQAGVEGAVVLRYVVDTLGRAEPGSVRVVNGEGGVNRLFVDAARDAVLQMRFAPAEAGGRKVRQLVEQRFAFELQR